MEPRRASGFTLIESLVVISIIVLLFSLLLPVFQAAKWQVKKTRSMSNMRQIHIALMLYCEDYEGGGPDGLGLPPSGATLMREESLPMSVFQTGGVPYIAPQYPAVFTWMPPAGPTAQEQLPSWLEHVERTGRNPIVLIDETFNHEYSPFVTHYAHGIYLDGHIEKRWHRGALTQFKIWEKQS